MPASRPDDPHTYAFAPPDPVGVSSAAVAEVCDRDGMWGAVAGEFFHGNAAFDPTGVADAILSGATGAGEAAGSAVGWLADVDWGGLLDWS